jgi:hypothetical protein
MNCYPRPGLFSKVDCVLAMLGHGPVCQGDLDIVLTHDGLQASIDREWHHHEQLCVQGGTGDDQEDPQDTECHAKAHIQAAEEDLDRRSAHISSKLLMQKNKMA